MTEPVLIIAPPNDPHAIAISQVLKSKYNTPVIIWDTKAFPFIDYASLTLSKGKVHFQINSLQQHITSLTSIWWRRPSGFTIDSSITDEEIKQYCKRESSVFLHGALEAIDVPIINHPAKEASAGRKPLQLKTAHDLGLIIPNTIMSNNPKDIYSFWEKNNGNCIYKPFTPPFWQVAETRLLTKEDFDHLDKLRHAPIIVQEKIEKGQDIRVNIFGEKVFAASVVINRKEANLDWRIDLSSIWKEFNLPEDITQRLVRLLRVLGLQYGCIDLRQRPDGEYVFLEINPSGQFIFIEVDTGQSVTSAFAELLLNPHLS